MAKIKVKTPAPKFGFSDEFKAKVREQIMPLSFKVLREVSNSPEILVEELHCLKCSFSKKFEPPTHTKATSIHDCEWTHEFSWQTGTRCGGQVAFVTSPTFELVSVPKNL